MVACPQTVRAAYGMSRIRLTHYAQIEKNKMMHIPQEKEVVGKLVAWGTAHPLVRAMILTSSRTRPYGPVDLLSDYDLILAVSEVGPFAFDDAWISEYGKPMVR